MEWRSLPAFSRWFLEQPFGALRPPMNALFHFETAGGDVHTMVLYRAGQFQAELISTVPGRAGGFCEHRHPNVDSIEVLLAGTAAFTVHGQRIATDEEIAGVAADGAAVMCGRRLPIRHSDFHAADVGLEGTAFLSLQKWLNGLKPSSIGLDWEGSPHIRVRGPGF